MKTRRSSVDLVKLTFDANRRNRKNTNQIFCGIFIVSSKYALMMVNDVGLNIE